jgi:hypothetical protein
MMFLMSPSNDARACFGASLPFVLFPTFFPFVLCQSWFHDQGQGWDKIFKEFEHLPNVTKWKATINDEYKFFFKK